MLARATKVLASKGSVLLSSKKPVKIGTSKEMLREIFHAALLAVDPYKAVNRHREEICRAYDLNQCNRLLLIGFGKAASPMSKAVADSLPDRLGRGIIITKYGHILPGSRRDRIAVFEAGHPLPDANGVRATQEVVRLLKGEPEDPGGLSYRRRLDLLVSSVDAGSLAVKSTSRSEMETEMLPSMRRRRYWGHPCPLPPGSGSDRAS